MLFGKQIFVSFITGLELLSFAHLVPASEKNIEGLLSSCTIKDVNRSIKKKTIQIRRDYKIKLPDAILPLLLFNSIYPYSLQTSNLEKLISWKSCCMNFKNLRRSSFSLRRFC